MGRGIAFLSGPGTQLQTAAQNTLHTLTTHNHQQSPVPMPVIPVGAPGVEYTDASCMSDSVTVLCSMCVCTAVKVEEPAEECCSHKTSTVVLKYKNTKVHSTESTQSG